MREYECFVSPKGYIVCNALHWPVVIVTWVGDNDEGAIRAFFEWNDEVVVRARERGGYLMISDADGAEGPPVMMRRLVAELTDAIAPDAKELSLGNYIVLSSALLRGALTAMQWISRDKWATKQVGSMQEAISLAFVDIDIGGKSRPRTLDPDSYERPVVKLHSHGS